VNAVIALLRHRSTVVWMALVSATLLSAWLGSDQVFASATARTVGSSGILVMAFVKIRFVALDFMELRSAALPLRLCFDAWIATVLSSLLVIDLTTR
jgi:hypothetical protein